MVNSRFTCSIFAIFPICLQIAFRTILLNLDESTTHYLQNSHKIVHCFIACYRKTKRNFTVHDLVVVSSNIQVIYTFIRTLQQNIQTKIRFFFLIKINYFSFCCFWKIKIKKICTINYDWMLYIILFFLFYCYSFSVNLYMSVRIFIFHTFAHSCTQFVVYLILYVFDLFLFYGHSKIKHVR